MQRCQRILPTNRWGNLKLPHSSDIKKGSVKSTPPFAPTDILPPLADGVASNNLTAFMPYPSILKDIEDKGCPKRTPPISMSPDEVVSADTISLRRRGFQYDNPFARTNEFLCVLSSMG